MFPCSPYHDTPDCFVFQSSEDLDSADGETGGRGAKDCFVRQAVLDREEPADG